MVGTNERVRPLRIFEMTVLVLVSFSPLLSKTERAFFTFLVLALNLRFLARPSRRTAFALFMLLSVFIVGGIVDLRNVGSIGDMNGLSIYFPMCFLLGFLLSEKYRATEYLIYLDKVAFIAAALSLVGVCVYIFTPELAYRMPIYQYYNTSHRTAYLFNILISSTGVVRRNAGIAWEPGAFQFLLNLGLYAHSETNKKVNTLRTAIYIAAVVFTRSTAGLIILSFIVVRLIQRDRVTRWLFAVSFLASIGVIWQEIVYHYTTKLVGSAYFTARMQPTVAAFRAAAGHVWGLGNSGYDVYYESVGTGPWDSFGQIFLRYGYPLLLIIGVILLELFKSRKHLALILLVTFLSQGIWFLPLVTPFYFIGLSKGSGTHGRRWCAIADTVVDEHTSARGKPLVG